MLAVNGDFKMRRAWVYVGLLLWFTAHTAVSAATIYTWIDAQGVRHFSQYPPQDPAQPAKTLTYESVPSSQDRGDRLQTIRDVARELETSRLQREDQRAKAAPPATPAPPAQPEREPPFVIVPYPYGSPYPPPYPYPQPPRHWPRHGPDKPDRHDDKPAVPKRDAGARIMP